MPLVTRYSNVIRGALTYTGNTLGFSSFVTPDFGIGAFLSTTVGLSAPGYPTPSTLNWQENGSTAILNIPAGSTIEYAELIWGGASISDTVTLPITTLNTPITFKTPLGINTITYDPATAFQQSVPTGQIFYTRSQNVTALVQGAGAGTYEVDGVPAVLEPTPFNTACAGWTLSVVYSNPSLPYSDLVIYVGNVAIDAGQPPVNTTISGFSTPASGTVNTRVLLSAMEGNVAPIIGDQVLLGPNTSSLITLSGPNNISNNFFASQINNDSGVLDTTGSFGTLNPNPNGPAVGGLREGWDITNINGTSNFVNSQTQSVVSLETALDTYAVSTLGLQIQVQSADLSIVKTVDKAYANTGDTLTYTLNVTNNGLANADNVVLTDTIPSGTTFVSGSITGTVPFTGTNPQSGISLTNPIVPGGTATISYKVSVGSSMPTTNPIPNGATSTYTFISAPGLTPIAGSSNSNIVTTQVNHADLIGANSSNFIKSVDKAYADVGDVLTYSFNISNTGNVTASNIVFTDTIPNGTTLVSGSVLVNGGAVAGSPATGVPVTDIPAGGSATVIFQVTVDTIPTPNPIPDTGTLNYKYTVNPSQLPVSGGGNSNTVTTQVNHADLIGVNGENFVKSANVAYAEVGGIITYTLTIKNTGNTIATNVLVTDIPPTGTTFIPGSTLINGLASTDSPVTGINAPNILPGASATVSFQVLVNAIPVPNPTVNTGNISYKYLVDPSQPPVSGGGTTNPVNVLIEQVSLQVVKSVDKASVIPGEVITYSTVISNTGTVTAQNVIFTDQIPAGTTFVPNSVTVGGVPSIGANPSSGVNVGSIAPLGFSTVTFQVTVNNPMTVNPITNGGVVNYKAQLCPTCPIESKSANSNITTSTVQIGQLTTIKTVDQKSTNVGSTITYTVVVTNTGTVPVQNAILTDTIPLGTMLVPNSVTVNGTQIPAANPSFGISLGTINVGAQAVVTFQVLVVSAPCPPELINQGVVNFDFTLANRIDTLTGSSTSTTATTDVGLISFKQLSVDENLIIPIQKPDAEDVLDATVCVEITRVEIIKTPVGESYEGQTLTGWKAIIYGKLKQKIKYVADEPTQSVHGAHFDVNFTTFIVLPSDYKKCCPIRIVPTVEDAYVQLLDKRTIFKNVTLLIEARTC